MRISDWSSDVCSSDLSASSSGLGRHPLNARSASTSPARRAAPVASTGASDATAGSACSPIKKGTRHVGDQNPLGSDPHRLPDYPHDHLGGNAVDRLPSRPSAAARPALVRAGRLADLLSAGLLLVVVLLRCLCPADLHRLGRPPCR